MRHRPLRQWQRTSRVRIKIVASHRDVLANCPRPKDPRVLTNLCSTMVNNLLTRGSKRPEWTIDATSVAAVLRAVTRFDAREQTDVCELHFRSSTWT